MNKRKSILIITILVLFSVLQPLFRYYFEVNNEDEKRDDIAVDAGIGEIPEDNMVDSSFESHLPLVVIDIGDEDIPQAYRYDEDKEVVVPIEGVDPFVNGSVYLCDGKAVNKVSDEPTAFSKMHIKYRGNSSLFYDKKQYKIELLNDDGSKKDLDFLGMGADSDWILNISMADKSLLRNYIAYKVAGEIDDYTPDAEYCEVLIKKGDKYEYEGLYLLCESIKAAKNRVELSDYNKDGISPFLVKRDRYDEEAVTLDTWATEKGLTYGYLSLLYPKEKDWDKDTVANIEKSISNAEKAIYSSDGKYGQVIDTASFVDYFLINEYFGNYDAGNNSTYMYSNLDGKLHIGPVWDFDGGMDNELDKLANVEKIAFQDRTLFGGLTKNYSFDEALSKRYRELRKNVLNEEHIYKLIDDTVKYIGKAQQRDWSRWSEAYESYELKDAKDEYGILISRNGYTYEEEVQKVKDFISEHSFAMKKELDKLCTDNDKGFQYGRNGIWAILFLVSFLSSIVIVRRK